MINGKKAVNRSLRWGMIGGGWLYPSFGGAA